MGRYDRLRQIERLDPKRDHVEIYHLMCGYEFPWDMTRALEVALYRTYCVPSISALLDKTGEFYKRTQKRYDDTALIVSEISKWGYDAERGREALRRINHAHSRFNISNDDYLYVLSTFIYEPVRWMDRFGWRKMAEHEKLASYYFWYEVGKRMGIRDIPECYEKFQQFAYDFERDNFRFAETNQRIGAATRDLFASWMPRIFAPLVRWGIYALLDDAMLASFGFPRPFGFMRRLVSGALKLRGRIVRILPARKTPDFFTDRRNRTYPRGYEIAKLGPPNVDHNSCKQSSQHERDG
jgi:ER-bound oxygenase mpaB/B'/Rubber oxygenase, catalytic domain